MKCKCKHEKDEHLRFGSKTLGLTNAYRDCTLCRCKLYRRARK